MRSFSLKFKLPDPDDVAGQLAPTADPNLHRARQALDAAADALSRARSRYAEMARTIADTRAAVLAGQETAGRLDSLLRERDVEASNLANFERRATEAAERVTAAERDALTAVIAEAGRRRDDLQQIAAQLAPALSRLRECEMALDRAVHAVKPGTRVLALEWPCALGDE